MVIGKIELLLDPDEEKAAILKPSDFKRLLREAGSGRNGKRNIAIVWMSFGSALRVTEIAKLKVKDLVAKSGKLKGEYRLPAAYTKNGESRMAYMLEPDHKKALAEYLDWRVEKCRRVSGTKEYRGLMPASPLFLGRGASGFTFRRKEYVRADGSVAEYYVCSSMQQLLSELFKNIGIKDGSSHSGRRTFATRLADRGVDIEYIRYLLGHKQNQQTVAYIESNKQRLRNILKGAYGNF